MMATSEAFMHTNARPPLDLQENFVPERQKSVEAKRSRSPRADCDEPPGWFLSA